jgi:hypothetical protein
MSSARPRGDHPVRVMWPIRDGRTLGTGAGQVSTARRRQSAVVFAEVGLGELLWSLLTIFFMVVYFIVLFRVVIDLFSDAELSGVAKAVWIVALLVFPLLSVLAYMIFGGPSMTQRSVAQAHSAESEFQDYVRQAAGTVTPADQIARARDLFDQGVIDAAEFDVLKQKALA